MGRYKRRGTEQHLLWMYYRYCDVTKVCDSDRNDSCLLYTSTAVVVSDKSEDGVAGINNRITVYFPEDDMEETYKLVTSIRGNSLGGYISTESPLGKALFGHKEGDSVKVKVNDDYSYEVVILSLIHI